MKLARITRLLGASLAAGLVVAACAPAPAAEQPDDAKPYIAIVSKGWQHAFWQAVQIGAIDEAARLGASITYEGPATEAEVDRQLTMLRSALDRNPDALCFAALDSMAAIPLMERAQEMGIPVIAFDSGVDSPIPVTTAATDNLAAAATAADKMAELIGGAGQVAVVVHDSTSITGIHRRDGFVSRMEEAHPDIEIVAIEYGAGDPLRSADLTKAVMARFPDLEGIFGANEGSAKGVLNALAETGRENEIAVIGYDSGAQQIEAIRAGVMAGAITQNPIGIGAQCVWAAMEAIAGREVPEFIDTGFFWYDRTNIDNPEIQALLYQ
ncbi:MAG TPA: ABC transporter substrate-binding protein [Patescibacteria group bacterium]|nr:ABC transporter substrate-binding protein [Patescibacteria group bacterium]